MQFLGVDVMALFFTKNHCRLVLSLAGAMLGLSITACAPVTFDTLPPEPKNSSYSTFFKLSVSEINIYQTPLGANNTAVAFQVLDSSKNHVANLQASDLIITENGTVVPPFRLNSNSKKIVQTVDIVFAVDITGSMASTIESAKTRLIDFVTKSRANGTHSRMCLVTFGDRTIKKCDHFYDNDPADPKTESQVKELISEISKLRALTGIDDPGGNDLNENPMRALIDASTAPWKSDAQRFVILITDDGFLYSPGNQGAVGNTAPVYNEVIQAIQSSQMQVFAATPSLAGYNLPFSGVPGIVAASGGEWFSFYSLISGKITLDTILNRIVNRLQTTYLAEYSLDDKSALDPARPLSQRKIEIRLANGQAYSVTIQSVQSNLPNGREPYKNRWMLTDKKMKKETISVRLNGRRLNGGYTITSEGEIVFDTPPPPESKIQVHYRNNAIRDAIQIEPIILPGTINPNAVTAILNGIETKDLEIIKTLDGTYSLRLPDSVFAENDPFGIQYADGLSVQVRLQEPGERH